MQGASIAPRDKVPAAPPWSCPPAPHMLPNGQNALGLHNLSKPAKQRRHARTRCARSMALPRARRRAAAARDAQLLAVPPSCKVLEGNTCTQSALQRSRDSADGNAGSRKRTCSTLPSTLAVMYFPSLTSFSAFAASFSCKPGSAAVLHRSCPLFRAGKGTPSRVPADRNLQRLKQQQGVPSAAQGARHLRSRHTSSVLRTHPATKGAEGRR